MNRSRHNHAERPGAGRNRPLSPVAAAGRFAPALACLLLLSGCAGLPDWIRNSVGGEGKGATEIVQPVAPPSRDAVLAVQNDLMELGYDPGPIDGSMGPRTRSAIEAYQTAAGTDVDGRITEQLIASLAAAPRTARVPRAASGPNGAFVPGPDFWARISARAEPEATVHDVKNAGIPPLYDDGDVYIWSTGRIETVAMIAGSKLFWRGHDGARYTADRNFLIPPSSWTGPAGAGEADARVDMDGSWPVKAGSPLTFTVSSGGAQRNWRCHSGGGKRVSVPAGRFDTVALICERDDAPAGEWLRREWLYAPAVRHYVARTDIMAGGGSTRMELVGIRPGAKNWPPSVRAGLDRSIQDALNDLPAGTRSLWSSTVVQEQVQIIPGPARNIVGAGRCRRFSLSTRGSGAARVYPALACRRGAGEEWNIPGDAADELGGVSFLHGAG